MKSAIDNFIQRQVDRLAGVLDGHGVPYPRLLREASVLESLSLMLVSLILLSVVPVAGWCLLLGAGLFAWSRWRSWRRLADDAHGWNANLAEQYARRALRVRETNGYIRLSLLLCSGVLLGLCVAAFSMGDTAIALVLSATLRILSMTVVAYIESSIPLPPPEPRLQTAPHSV